jgi:hypothetical protein
VPELSGLGRLSTRRVREIGIGRHVAHAAGHSSCRGGRDRCRDQEGREKDSHASATIRGRRAHDPLGLDRPHPLIFSVGEGAGSGRRPTDLAVDVGQDSLPRPRDGGCGSHCPCPSSRASRPKDVFLAGRPRRSCSRTSGGARRTMSPSGVERKRHAASGEQPIRRFPELLPTCLAVEAELDVVEEAVAVAADVLAVRRRGSIESHGHERVRSRITRIVRASICARSRCRCVRSRPPERGGRAVDAEASGAAVRVSTECLEGADATPRTCAVATRPGVCRTLANLSRLRRWLGASSPNCRREKHLHPDETRDD